MVFGKRVGGALLFGAGIIAAETFGWGWSKLLDWVLEGVNWTSENVWGVVSIAMMLGGLTLIFWPSPKEESPEPTSERLSRLARDLLYDIEMSRLAPTQIIAEIHALMVEFEGEGFQLPLVAGAPPDQMIEKARMYFSALQPLLRNNRLDQAKQIAQNFA